MRLDTKQKRRQLDRKRRKQELLLKQTNTTQANSMGPSVSSTSTSVSSSPEGPAAGRDRRPTKTKENGRETGEEEDLDYFSMIQTSNRRASTSSSSSSSSGFSSTDDTDR